MVKSAVPLLTDTRPLPSDRLKLSRWIWTLPVPLSVTVKLPEMVWPKTLMWSLVPVTVMVRVVPFRAKVTLTPPLIETPVTPLREIWPPTDPPVMWKLVSWREAEPPVIRTSPLPREMLRLERLRLPVPLLEMVPTMVPEIESARSCR